MISITTFRWRLFIAESAFQAIFSTTINDSMWGDGELILNLVHYVSNLSTMLLRQLEHRHGLRAQARARRRPASLRETARALLEEVAHASPHHFGCDIDINFLISLIPISFIAGNLIINLNIL